MELMERKLLELIYLNGSVKPVETALLNQSVRVQRPAADGDLYESADVR